MHFVWVGERRILIGVVCRVLRIRSVNSIFLCGRAKLIFALFLNTFCCRLISFSYYRPLFFSYFLFCLFGKFSRYFAQIFFFTFFAEKFLKWQLFSFGNFPAKNKVQLFARIIKPNKCFAGSIFLLCCQCCWFSFSAMEYIF